MRKTCLLLVSMLFLSYAYSQSVTLYEDCNYRGGSRTLSPGRYSLDRVGFGGGRLSSFRVPRGLKLVLYDGNEPGTGSKMRYESDMACLSRDWNDRARSILIEYENSGGGNNNSGNYPVYPSYGGSGGARVILYEDCSLMGNSAGLGPGSYDTRDMRIRNDAISSIRIPSGYSVTVFKDGGFRGQSQTYYSNVYCMDGRWTDQVSSIIIRGPGENSSNSNNYYPSGGSSSGDRVEVFEECNFRGSRGEFKPGSYKTGYLIVRNDRISSMRIPRGFRVIAFENDDFKGNRRTFTGDQYCLDGQWNDKISSIVVEGPGGSNNYNNNADYFQQNQSNNNYSGVAVYWDSWYRGDHVIFNPGYHDLRNGNIAGNISSMSIQPGYRVTVYDDFNFRGRSQTFTSSVANLSTFGWNDRIRSVIVSRD